jgi:hypothetical protein
MQLSGPQSLSLIFGLSGLIRGVGVVAVLVTLITIELVLVLMVSNRLRSGMAIGVKTG